MPWASACCPEVTARMNSNGQALIECTTTPLTCFGTSTRWGSGTLTKTPASRLWMSKMSWSLNPDDARFQAEPACAVALVHGTLLFCEDFFSVVSVPRKTEHRAH